MTNTTAHRPTALITGAAKRVGAVIATHLAASGWDIVLHYRHSHSEAEALAAKLRTVYDATVTLHRADLSAPLDSFWKGLPACELLVLNAAIYERDTLADVTAARLAHQMNINLQVPLLLAQGFMAQLPENISGNIVALGDGAMGWSIAPQFFSYSVSKLAWPGIIDLLAAAVAPRARANLLTLPPMLPNTGEDEAMFDRLAQRTPLKRRTAPTEIGTAIDFLLAAPGVTGQTISLANGLGLVSARHEA